MTYQALVILIALIHLAFVLFVFFGALLALRWRRVVWLHIPAGIWAAVIELGGFVCPLTWIELQVRQAAGLPAYYGGFIVHYMLNPLGAPPAVQQSMGYIVLGINVAIYSAVIAVITRKSQFKRASADAEENGLPATAAVSPNT